METKEEKSYRISPKGWIAVRLGLINLPNNFDVIDSFRDDLANFARQQAAADGMTTGTPCLIFKDGGHCITLEAVEGVES